MSLLLGCALATSETHKTNQIEKMSMEFLWTSPHLGYSSDGHNWPILVDVDMDSRKDIIVLGDRVFCFSPTGKQISNISGIIMYTNNPWPFLANFDSDEPLELFVACDDVIYIIDLSTWNIDFWIDAKALGGSRAFISGMLWGNYDEDEYPELLLTIPPFGLYIYDLKEARFIFVMNDTEVENCPIWGQIAPIGNDRYVFLNYPYFMMGAFDLSERRLLWCINLSDFGMDTALKFFVGDFDEDGVREVVASGVSPELYVFDGETGRLEAYFNFTDYLGPGFVLNFYGFQAADLEGDGVIEGIVPMAILINNPGKAAGILAIIDMKSYSIKKIIEFPPIPSSMDLCGIDMSSVNILDVNLDGVYDILFMRHGNITIIDGEDYHTIFAFNVSTFFKNITWEGFFFFWSDTDNNIVVRDIDNDGYIEIISVCGAFRASLYRLIIEPKITPLIYWNPPDGITGTFFVYENLDNDHDGVADWIEAEVGLSNQTPDTDGDGVPDRQEVLEIYRRLAQGGEEKTQFSVLVLGCFVVLVAVFSSWLLIRMRKKNK